MLDPFSVFSGSHLKLRSYALKLSLPLHRIDLGLEHRPLAVTYYAETIAFIRLPPKGPW